MSAMSQFRGVTVAGLYNRLTGKTRKQAGKQPHSHGHPVGRGARMQGEFGVDLGAGPGVDMGLGLLPFGESSAPFGDEAAPMGDVPVEDLVAEGMDVGPFGDHHLDLPGGSLHQQDDYGAGDTGIGVNNVLGSSGDDGGGLDPFKVAEFGDDAAAAEASAAAEFEGYVRENLTELAADGGELMSYQPAGPDSLDAPEQVPTLRNPLIAFGDDMNGEMYTSFNAAPIIGIDVDDEDCFTGALLK